MKTHAPVRASSKPAITARADKDDLAPSERIVQASPQAAAPQGALHDFSRMALPFRGSAADQIVHAAARYGVSTPASTLPHGQTIQRAFGRHDITKTPAHVTLAAAESAEAIGTKGYTAYGHVVFGRGADLRTAAHEAAHVVQQQRGVQLSGGTGRVGDPYERHADAVAEWVVAGRSAEGLLDRVAPRASARQRDGLLQSGHLVQARIHANPMPGMIADYSNDGHLEQHSRAPARKALLQKISVRNRGNDITLAAGANNNLFEEEMAKELARQREELIRAGKSGNITRKLFSSVRDAVAGKINAAKKVDSSGGQDPDLPADLAADEATSSLHTSHKKSSKEIQDIIATAATNTLKGSIEWAPVTTLIEKIRFENWAKKKDGEQTPAQQEAWKEYMLYKEAVDKNYNDAWVDLFNAQSELAAIKKYQENWTGTPPSKNGAVALTALAETIGSSPKNLMIGLGQINIALGERDDFNARDGIPSPESKSMVEPTPYIPTTTSKHAPDYAKLQPRLNAKQNIYMSSGAGGLLVMPPSTDEEMKGLELPRPALSQSNPPLRSNSRRNNPFIQNNNNTDPRHSSLSSATPQSIYNILPNLFWQTAAASNNNTSNNNNATSETNTNEDEEDKMTDIANT